MKRMLLLAAFLAAARDARPAESKQAQTGRIFSAFHTHTPGCPLGAAYRGQVALKSGYGMADLERNAPITADTVCERGPVARQFTAAALLRLARQGRISLDDRAWNPRFTRVR